MKSDLGREKLFNEIIEIHKEYLKCPLIKIKARHKLFIKLENKLNLIAEYDKLNSENIK